MIGKLSHSSKDHTGSANPADIAGVRLCQRPSPSRTRSVRTGQQKLYRYRVKYDIDSWTTQSLLNRYVRRDCRAFWHRAVPCCRSTNDVLIVRLHTDALNAASTASRPPSTTV